MKRDIIVACECRCWIDEVCIVFCFLCIFFCVRLFLALLFQSANAHVDMCYSYRVEGDHFCVHESVCDQLIVCTVSESE